MSNKSQRIKVNLNDDTERHLKVKLDQNVETLNILSLEIDQRNTTQLFNADYGVLVGRVIANGGVGIPNAKVSIFIPIDEDDQNNPDIVTLYPYTTPRDTNQDGKRYNLLPRVGRNDPETNTIRPQQPFGSFPIKEEIVTNETLLDVYKRYYKYSTVTNNSGDYMLFGVPVGVQTVHMSVDITDIGRYSMTVPSMITNLGLPENLFSNDRTRIKEATDLDDLPNIETQEISVDIIPFWGDTDNFTIGITRQDFRIRAVLNQSVVIFGSHFTMGDGYLYGTADDVSSVNEKEDAGFYRMEVPDGISLVDATQITNSRINDLNISIFTYPSNIDLQDVNDDINDNGSRVDPQTDLVKLTTDQYDFFNQDGMFALIIPCNRGRVITNQFGDIVPTNDDNPAGVFTEFAGSIIFAQNVEGAPLTANYERRFRSQGSFNSLGIANVSRGRFKVPQGVVDSSSIANPDFDSIRYSDSITSNSDSFTDNMKNELNRWRKRYKLFEGGKYYSVAQFYPCKYIENSNNNDINRRPDEGSFLVDVTRLYNFPIGEPQHYIGLFTTPENSPNFLTVPDFPYNDTRDNLNRWGGQWLNSLIYFPQYTSALGRTIGNDIEDRNQQVADIFHKDYKVDDPLDGKVITFNNNQEVMGGEINSIQLLSANSYKTDFIEVPLEDIAEILELNQNYLFNGRNSDFTNTFRFNNLTTSGQTRDYKYDAPSLDPANYPSDIRNVDANLTPFTVINSASDSYNVPANNPYFCKGVFGADCYQLLVDLSLIKF